MKAITTKTLSTGLLALAVSVSAQVANKCATTDVCYKLNIPESTASSGTGDIFFQITAPSTYQWAALAQGDDMVGANMFIIYTNAAGDNVTLSPRQATSYVQPDFNSAANVTLLEGSGIKDGVMTANVKCSNCNSWSGGLMDFSASNAKWIYAFQSSNGAKNSDDQSASIFQHTNRGVFTWDFANAKGGSSVNPLLAAPAGPTAPQTPGNGGSNSGSDGGSIIIDSSPSQLSPKLIIAHGVLASLAFVILFPMGSIAISLSSMRGIIWIHAAFQLFAYVVYIAGFGLGVYIALHYSLLKRAHPIIGIVLLAVLFIQPFLGLLHHMLFKKKGKRTLISHAHIWVGRLAITLGIINGGLGLRLAKMFNLTSQSGIIAYSVVAGVMFLVFVVAIVLGERRKAARRNEQPKYASSPRQGSGDTDSRPMAHEENGHYAPPAEK